MGMLIDIHCHIDFYKEPQITKILDNAKKATVKIILNNAVNPESIKKTLKLSVKYPEIKSALGIYPTDALKLTDKEIEEEIKLIRKAKPLAIGEVGLDQKEKKDLERQITILKKFIKLSMELDVPIIIHSRKAEKECIEILEELNAKKVIMHCFSGNFKLVGRIKENNWHFSIPTCIVSSEHFQKIVKIIPITQLFCETDSPYLHPFKKPNNEPANVIESYKKIAEIKEISLKEVEEEIEKNYEKLFK